MASRSDRLVLEANFAEPRLDQCLLEPLDRQGVVLGISSPDEANGSAHTSGRDRSFEAARRLLAEVAEQTADQTIQRPPLAKDRGRGEETAGQERLRRLDQAPFDLFIRKVGRQRRRAGADQRRAALGLRKVENRAKRLREPARPPELFSRPI